MTKLKNIYLLAGFEAAVSGVLIEKWYK